MGAIRARSEWTMEMGIRAKGYTRLGKTCKSYTSSKERMTKWHKRVKVVVELGATRANKENGLDTWEHRTEADAEYQSGITTCAPHKG